MKAGRRAWSTASMPSGTGKEQTGREGGSRVEVGAEERRGSARGGGGRRKRKPGKSKGKAKTLEPPPDVVRRAPAGSASVFEQQRTEPGFKPGGDGERPSAEEARQRQATESAFVIAWLGLGGVILFQGLALAASGFLPAEWDSFLVKFLYPSFTPTVLLFIGGTTGYGVFKYFEGEKSKS